MPTKIDGHLRKPVIMPDVQLSKTQQAKLKELLKTYRDEVNTNVQGKVVDELWKNMQQEVVAKYIAPPVLRYLVPRPTDPIVAEYIAPAPADLSGPFDPAKYTGSGAENAKTINARGKARATAGKKLRDEMVMFYLVAPPPPDAKQAAAFNKLRKQDKGINTIFKNLLKSTQTYVMDKKLTDSELQKFTRLHYAFDLASKTFYDGVDKYFKDFPGARTDIEEAAKHKAPGEPQIYYIIAPPRPPTPPGPDGPLAILPPTTHGPYYIIAPNRGDTSGGVSPTETRNSGRFASPQARAKYEKRLDEINHLLTAGTLAPKLEKKLLAEKAKIEKILISA